MRQGHQNNKRMRGRGGRKGSNPLQRSYESNGPDVKIRGNALHVAEKYVQLARDAASSGDRVAEQNYLQHAEHYYRIVAAAQAQMPQPQQSQRNDDDDDRDESSNGRANGESAEGNDRGDNRPRGEQSKPAYGLSEPQPYTNGGGDTHGEGDEANASAAENGAGDDDAPPQPAPRRRRAPRQRAPRGEIRVAAEEATAAEE